MGKPNEADINDDAEDFVDELKPGTELMHGQYKIESFLNAGGFGITYLARDSLDRKIVIKECFPGAFCRRSRSIVQARSRAHQPELQSIVRLFVQEAKSLAKLNHPNIVGVHQVFEDNDTAYMALDFVEGRDMLDTMDDPDAVMTPEQIKSMLVDVLGAVQFIHDQDILHRDISPDNILIDPEGRPVLIDFGAAREQATKQSRVLSALRVVKDGYSPQEFYIAGSEQNASSDLYALGASFYHFITGDVPPNSQARLAAIASDQTDPYVKLEGTLPGYDDNFLAAMDKALAILPKDRVQSAQEWLNMMDGRQPGAAPVAMSSTTGNAADPVGAAVSATVPANDNKSKMGLLLASAAVVAVVGVGAAMTLGGGDTPETEQVSAAQQAAEEAAQVAAAEAAAAAEEARTAEVAAAAEAAAQAGRLAEAEAAAAQAAEAAAETERLARAEAEAEAEALRTALAEAQAAAEEERTARAEEFARLAEENTRRREEQAEARELAEAQAAAEARAASEAQAAAEAQAVAAEEARVLAEALAAEEEARRLAEAEAKAAGEAAERAAALAAEAQARADAAALAAATLDTPTPPMEVEGATLLSTLAGAPETPLALLSDGLPTDVSLGQVFADAQIANLVPGAVILAGAEAADPQGDVDFVTASFQLSAGIPAFAPGNEVVTDQAVPEVSAVMSAWSVELPFAASTTSSRVIDEVATIAPVWVDTGVEINTVNGQSISSIAGIDDVLRQSVNLTDEDMLAVSFGVKQQDSDDLIEESWAVPIIQRTALLNGLNFETRLINDEWVTKVTDAPANVSGDLKVGDQIIAYMRTSEKVDQRTSMKSILDRELAEGQSQFSFAVSREGSMWIASLDYADPTQ